ncbi:Carbohydrate sulfotransferase 1, partial [Pterocles gutturalis]
MQCSWKAVLLLALASIAIQYTAIRTFTAKSFHSCPIPSPVNCSLSQDTDAADRLCDESPTFSYNLSRKTHVLILATTRSGSSFVGQLFNQHFDVFYFKALCSPPVCESLGAIDLHLEEGDCVKKCGTLNLTLATESCREHGHVAIKTVRVPEVSDLRALVEDPRLNLKVIQLVRDPRGILASRSETFRDTYRLWRIWDGTGRKPYNLDVTQLTTVCEDFWNSVSTGLNRPPWLKGKYMLVRYEDLARNPMKKTEEIYDFLGIPMDSNVERWIQNNTRGDRSSSKHKYGTVRNSAATAEKWR